jgi:hypothetical protein
VHFLDFLHSELARKLPLFLHGKNQATKAAAVGCVLLPRFSAATDSARRFR